MLSLCSLIRGSPHSPLSSTVSGREGSCIVPRTSRKGACRELQLHITMTIRLRECVLDVLMIHLQDYSSKKLWVMVAQRPRQDSSSTASNEAGKSRVRHSQVMKSLNASSKIFHSPPLLQHRTRSMPRQTTLTTTPAPSQTTQTHNKNAFPKAYFGINTQGLQNSKYFSIHYCSPFC